MPRDSNGNYVLPSGNPVVTGTVISAIWANPTMADVAEELTNSLDRNGRGGMLAPFKFLDGDVTAPGITWTSEPTSGIFRNGLSDMRWSIAGNSVFGFSGAGASLFNGLTLALLGPTAGGGGSYLQQLDVNTLEIRNVSGSALTRMVLAGVSIAAWTVAGQDIYSGKYLRFYDPTNATARLLSKPAGNADIRVESRGALLHWDSTGLVLGSVVVATTAPTGTDAAAAGQMTLVY